LFNNKTASSSIFKSSKKKKTNSNNSATKIFAFIKITANNIPEIIANNRSAKNW